MTLVDHPDERLEFSPAVCRGCGCGLDGEPVLDQRRHQVTDIVPPPPPKVTEYVAQSKACPCCGMVSEGVLPAHVRARASYGPEAHAQAAYLACGHHVPVGRVAVLLCQLAGITVSTGWVAGIRGKAAALNAGVPLVSGEILVLNDVRQTLDPDCLRKIIACGEAAGFEWAFFTATAPLKALLERLGLPLMPLATADRARVANPESWGTYYELSPSVYAVHRDVVGACMGRDARAASNG